MNPNLDWTLIRSFLAVMESGSLLGAARKLNGSQPTLGRHIAQFEEQLGVPLFERTGRALVPTAAARKLAEHAATMQAGADSMARSLAASEQPTQGTVRISASQAVACYLLPPLLARLREQAPRITIVLVSSNAITNLLRREADIAIRMVRPQQTSLIARRIASVEVSACAHRQYLSRRGVPRDPIELLDHELVGFDTDDTYIRGFKRFGQTVTREQFAFRTDDHIAAWQAIRAGLGIGFAARYMIEQEAQVQRILPKLVLPPLPVWLTVHREIRGSPRIRAVYDFLAEEIPGAITGGDR